MSVQELYDEWMEQDLPPYLIEDLINIKSSKKDITERFYQSLSFGTGGMRGILGAGTNRMNIYTIRLVAEGLAQYIIANEQNTSKKDVVIAYDTRHFSLEFACETARVLGKHGIYSYVYRDPRPTPQLSFTIRELNACAGVMITASHNSRHYNGFKVYGKDGAQMMPQSANEIISYMDNVINLFSIEAAEISDLEASGLFTWLSDDLDTAYLNQLSRLKNISSDKCDLNIVYTPLHGAGLLPIKEGLRQFGFEKVSVVEEQVLPDGDFPTLTFPNPEENSAFEKAIELGNNIGAELLLASDPDADRLGVAVRNKDNYDLLNGNQLGALLIDYILSTKKDMGSLPDNGIIFKTIVTSELGAKIASYYQVKTESTLPGFKYIARNIEKYKNSGEYTYLFGYEESCGYLIEPFSRDKDAVQAALKVAEMAAVYSKQGCSLLDRLEKLYRQFGYHQEALLSQTFEGKDGQENLKNVLEGLRADLPSTFGNISVICIEDYLTGKGTLKDGTEYQLTLPQEDVIKFILEDESWITIRPSGTEPKCKFYIGVVDEYKNAALEKLENLKQDLLRRFDI